MGEYLSIDGDGTYLFNVISALICLPIFYYSFKRYSKKVYLLIIGAGFVGLAIYLERKRKRNRDKEI